MWQKLVLAYAINVFTDGLKHEATGNSRSAIPWNSRESRTPKIPGGNSREFLKFWRKLRGISRVLSFFSNFYC